MNRVNRLESNLNDAVLSALKRFSENYFSFQSQKQKDEADYHANEFIERMTDSERERASYLREYRKLTGRKSKSRPSTRLFMTPVN